MRDPEVRAARLRMLDEVESVQPLRDWAEDLADRRSAVVPHVDPADAGVAAKVLFLLEAPGPMTNSENARPGSGFISVDNDDQTAANCWIARKNAGLDVGALHWNIVPWYLGAASIKPTTAELARGAMELRRLLPLLTKLRVVIFAGKIAQQGWHTNVEPFVGTPYATIDTWHPSPLSMNQPGHRDEFQRAIDRAARLL
jgi:hypothetical protein